MVGVADALAVEHLAISIPQAVDVAVVREHLEGPIDSGKADVFALVGDELMEALGRQESICRIEGLADDGPGTG